MAGLGVSRNRGKVPAYMQARPSAAPHQPPAPDSEGGDNLTLRACKE